VTQIEDIQNFIDGRGRNELFTITDVDEMFGFPRPSIRRVLSHLANEGRITRVERGLFKVGGKVDVRRKFVSGLFYCGGKKRQFFAQTLERNNIDREEDLIKAIETTFGNCSDMRKNHGYTDDIVTESEVSGGSFYPEIETGEL